MADSLKIEIKGDRAVIRACEKLPRDAQRELKDGAEKAGRRLANAVRAAGRAEGRQAARASRTVRTARRVWPMVIAGPHPLLFGSEFGVLRRFGWYAHPRYFGSPARQFAPHRGSASYWFFRTREQMQPQIEAEWREVADRVVAQWKATAGG